jgi:murein DD-endopeptidase MepM/ murein hydrolase activator NlpD
MDSPQLSVDSIEGKRRVMRKIYIFIILLAVAFLIMKSNFNIIERTQDTKSAETKYREIAGRIRKGETLFDIFKKYRLDFEDFFKMREASASIHRLKELYPGQPYKILVTDDNQIDSLVYWIDDDYILNITRTESGFLAEKVAVEYEKRIMHIGGTIKDNLISSVGEDRENLMLALQLSDIFAWDIDFTTDLRNDDIFKIIVEGLYLNGEFKKYGEILSAEFSNNGEIYHAYRFEYNGNVDYYDDSGKSLRRAFLKAPLSFRRISSGFSRKRYHPILKIYRPHLGVDYAASTGTPVSAIGDGRVIFAGYKGQNGNIVAIRHFNGYRTFYGHLSKIVKGIRKGVKVKQGQVIGYVGATGLATGPHLDYRIKVNNRFVNPLTLKLPRGSSVPKKLRSEFRDFKNKMDTRLASITPSVFAFAEKGID